VQHTTHSCAEHTETRKQVCVKIIPVLDHCAAFFFRSVLHDDLQRLQLALRGVVDRPLAELEHPHLQHVIILKHTTQLVSNFADSSNQLLLHMQEGFLRKQPRFYVRRRCNDSNCSKQATIRLCLPAASRFSRGKTSTLRSLPAHASVAPTICRHITKRLYNGDMHSPRHRRGGVISYW